MGQCRERIKRLKCGECLADGYSPCLSKITGKPINGFHKSRRSEGRHDHLNREVGRLEARQEGEEYDAEEFWMFAHIALGLHPRTYHAYIPQTKWRELYDKHPGLDPDNQYHGEW